MQATFVLTDEVQTVSFFDPDGRFILGQLINSEKVQFTGDTWTKDQPVGSTTTTGAVSTTTANLAVTTTASGPNGIGVIIGDPHVKVQVPGQDPICFDLHPEQYSAKFSLLEDKVTDLRVFGKFEKDLRGKHSRLTEVEIWNGNRKATVSKNALTIDGETFPLSSDATMEFGTGEVSIESLVSSRIPGVTFSFDGLPFPKVRVGTVGHRFFSESSGL